VVESLSHERMRLNLPKPDLIADAIFCADVIETPDPVVPVGFIASDDITGIEPSLELVHLINLPTDNVFDGGIFS